MSKVNQSIDYGTCVVLVVIPNGSNKVLTHDKFFKLFSPYGTIQRILIFERGIQWKTFVEYDSHEAAVRARIALNGSDFGDDTQLKMNVFASALKKITLSESNNTSGVDYFTDYTILRQKNGEKTHSNARTPVTATKPAPPAASPKMVPPIYQEDYWQFQQIPTQPQYGHVQQQFFYQQPMFDQTQINFSYLSLQTNLQQQMYAQLQEINLIMLKLQNFYNIQPSTQQIFLSNEQQLPIIQELMESQKKFGLMIEQYDQMQKQFRSFLINQNAPSPLIHNPYEIHNLKQEYNQTYKEEKELSDSQVPIQFVQTMQDAESTNDIQQSMQSVKLQQKAKEYGSQQLETQKNVVTLPIIKSDGNRKDFFVQDPLSYKDSQSINDKGYDEEAADDDLIFSCFRNQEDQMKLQKKNLKKQKSVEDFEEKDKVKEFIYKDRTPQLSRNPNPPFKKTTNLSEKNLEDNIQDPSEYYMILKNYLQVVRKSKVIYARWFDKKLTNLKMLYNLFSTYGNIEKMIFLKERSSVLVQYQTQDYAQQAKDCLNDVNFYGSTIKIFFSNYDEIFLKATNIEKGSFNEDTVAQEEYFQGCEDTNRFKIDCNYSFLPPSDTISILNIPKQISSNDQIQQLFEKFGKIEKIKCVQHPNNKNICYLKFDSTDSALKALSNMHGSEISGRIIHLMFAKYNF